MRWQQLEQLVGQAFHLQGNRIAETGNDGVMAARSAAAGIVVTSGRFTDDATDFATVHNIRLIDGHDLHALVRAARSAAPIPQRSAEAPPPAMGSVPVAAPGCPACAKPMIRRMAERDAQAGRAFWGCSDHPACKGTRTVR